MNYFDSNTNRVPRGREDSSMRTISRRAKRGSAARNLLTGVGASILILGGAACNQLLEVEIPGRVAADELESPLLIPALMSGAIGQFECAFNQYIPTTGIVAGEYIISGLTINSNIWGWRGAVELRGTAGSCPNTAGATGYGFYTPLQTARFQAEDTYRRLESFTDAQVTTRVDRMAQMAAYAGYANQLLGEGFCNMSVDEGPLLTRAQMFARAEEWFNRAITAATTAGNTAILNMARVGRARARLNLGNTAGANTDASAVPAAFVRNAVYSLAEPRRENRTYNAALVARDISVAAAYRNLTVGSPAVPDTRVRAVFANRNGQDGVTPQWDQLKYGAKTTPIPIASYTEARLIMAEAQGGAAGVAILAALRAGASLPALTAAEADPANFQATLIEERRRWLFSEGHRYNDMLRFNIPFPSGVNHKNQAYGNVTCLPLPDVETINNPNL